jgi:heat-inducible transcriptional repressor
LEHKELLKGLFDDKQLPAVSDPQIQVYIGDETPIQSMKDCSVVTANYVLGDGLRGTIGIIGPKRMDYEKVVGTLRNLVSQLNDTFNQ